MPEAEYCFDRKLWIKQCSSCKEVFSGNITFETSQVAFQKIFNFANRLADGFQTVCKKCHNESRRRRNGVNDGYDENEIYKKQGGACALCTIELHLPYRYPCDPQGARLDHDHKTGRVRGLLCHRCNAMIGMYEAIMDVFPEFDLNVVDRYIEKDQ